MSRTRIAVWFSLAFSLISIPAQAERRGRCKEDFDKYCAGKPNPECIAANLDKFSEECKKVVKKRAERREKIKAECTEDIAKLCKDLKTEHELIVCLRSNHEKLGEKCRAAMVPRRKGKEKK